MEHIIVLVDVENKKIMLFGAYNKEISFEDIYLLPTFLKEKDVLYISQVQEVDGNDVIASVEALVGSPPAKRYIHSKVEGYVRAPDIRLTLSGPRDSKSLDKLGYDIFDKSSSLRKLLLEDKIEIISEEEAIGLKKQISGAMSKDKSLDEIIVKTSVKEAMEQDSFFDDQSLDEVTSDEDVLTEAEQFVRQGIGKRTE